jgi:hypothetical protein
VLLSRGRQLTHLRLAGVQLPFLMRKLVAPTIDVLLARNDVALVQ